MGKTALDRSSLVQMGEARACWRASTQRVYESGDKNGRLLYWWVAGQCTSQIVPSVLNESGELCSETPAVAEAFALFYKKLYAE